LSRALEVVWTFPDSMAKIREMYSYVVANPEALTDDFYARRLDVLRQNGYPEYFSSMFGGDKRQYIEQLTISTEELAAVRAQVVFIHGVDDQLCPYDVSVLPFLRSVPGADAVLLNHCGHGPALEQSQKFLHAVRGLFG
jgi:pimeloyl-ACP methyl ester carboxylesterase